MEYAVEEDRIYAADESGKVLAEVTFPTTDGVSVIDHTFVDPSLRGQGVADKLLRLAADTILERGNKIDATCTYGVAWFARHPEYPIVCSGPAACKVYARR